MREEVRTTNNQHQMTTKSKWWSSSVVLVYDLHRGIVKSRSTPVGGPVKSGRKWTKDKGRGLDKELVRPELVTAWIQRLRTMSVDPLRRFRSRG